MKTNIFKAGKFLAIGCATLMLSVTSCTNWLDVNNDPDNPNSSSAVVENRLPWIQRGFMYHAGVANMRGSAMAGSMYSNNVNVGNSACAWDCRAGLTTTPYQSFFCMCGNNLKDLETKAAQDGSTHYAAAAKVVRAMGFMNFLDLYGEMPMSHAFMSEPTPQYDNGKQIYEQCMAELDEAIKLFSEPQAAGSTPLSRGDMWLNGNADEWLRLCHSLKARYMMRLTKRADWSADAVLAEAELGMQSNADNAVQKCYNMAGEVTDWLMGDPINTNGNWNYAAYGNNQRMSKFHKDLLVNAGGKGVIDPRMAKIVPAVAHNMVLDASGVVTSFDWYRTDGVDFYDDANGRLKGGVTSIQLIAYTAEAKEIKYSIEDIEKYFTLDAFKAAREAQGATCTVDGGDLVVVYPAGTHYINSANPLFADDWKYGNLISASTNTGTKIAGAEQDVLDLYYYAGKAAAARQAGACASTGSYQIRCVSDFEIMCYDELCFIKAECYLRKNVPAEAQKWYIEGIKANFERMQKQLKEWQTAGYQNPDMMPMADSDIDAYLASAAVATQCTMRDIMEQKYIALGFRLENWVDVRRLNYAEDIYPGIKKPAMFTGVSIKGVEGDRDDVMGWPRRFRLPATLELQYNMNQALAVNAHALDDDIWSYPVWWDCTSDKEYEDLMK